MHGYPVAAGAVLGIMAIALWHHHKLPRVQAFLFIASAFFLTVGMTVWLDALAGLTAEGTGLTVLLVTLGLGILVVWFQVIRKHKHHHIWTNAICITFGVAVVLGIALWHVLLHKGVKTVPKTGQALAQAVLQVRSGNAATALPASQAHEYLAAGIGALVLLVFLGFRHERGKKAASKGGPPAITSGRGGSRSSGRPAITSGRRR
jgi:drug/metabolite transporter (DMT)-like permease